LSNTATVEPAADQIDVNPANNTATDVDTITRSIDLAITKTDNRGGSSIADTTGSAVPGGTITYTIVVTNSGPSDAVGASVNDTFPAKITSDSFTATGTTGTSFTASGTGNIHDTVNVPAGGSITYTVTAHISATATGSLSNTATVTAPSGETDTNLSNNTATDTDTLTPTAALVITKVDNVGGSSVTGTRGSVAAGGILIYTITLTNMGPSNATGAKLSDVFPSSISLDTFTAASTTGATGFTAVGTGTINDTLTLPAGSSVTYTVTAHVSATATVGATMANSSVVTPPSGLTDTSPTIATDTDLITASMLM
jgi:uncharacterized repeat protein (TIGR01451 family)